VVALQETESNLNTQIATLKAEKDKKVKEVQAESQKTVDTLKTKLTDLEKRTREAEHYRGNLFLEHEKERAKWALERDHLIS
jgi:hypothetical protein